MLATDPLSLVFLGCLLFSGIFLMISLATGAGHGHLIHAGQAGHIAHAGHVGHMTGHTGAVHTGDAAHTAGGHASAQAGPLANMAPQSPLSAMWASTTSALAGSLNLLSILTFLFCFGLVGYLLHNFSRPGPFLSLFLPALFGAAAAVGVGVTLTRLFAVSTGELTTEGTRIEGRVGTVSMAIEPNHVGEVIFARANGGRQSIGARGQQGEALAVGSEVVILAVTDGIATVQSWDAFMRNARVHVPGASPDSGPLPPTASSG